MDRPDLAEPFADARGTRRAPGRARRGGRALDATLTADEALARLEAHSIPAGLINTAPDLAVDDHIAARDMILRLAAGFEQAVPMNGIVPKLSRTPGSIRSVGPELGEHTDQVLRELLGSRRRHHRGATWRRRHRLSDGEGPVGQPTGTKSAAMWNFTSGFSWNGGCSMNSHACASARSWSVVGAVVQHHSTMMPLGSIV